MSQKIVENIKDSFQPNLSNLAKKWALASRLIISIVVLGYLVFIPFKGLDKNRRLETTEVGLLTIILLLNSSVIERIEKLQLGSNGVELNLVHSKIKANIEANQKESKALALLGTLIEDDENQRKFFDSLLDDGERTTLENLFNAEKDQRQFPYKKEQSCEQRLRHLRVLGFIESLTNYQINELPPQGNLRDYFKLTCTGKICLALGSSNIAPQDILNQCGSDCHCHKILTQIIEKQGQYGTKMNSINN
ncbi:MAG: hypothetical protein V7K97_00155 [Nostoc sp.]|uniref:hypothetical protein n=1 Tax=Nostoc sp. TaxID=1180 RepID=UPI002FF76401